MPTYNDRPVRDLKDDALNFGDYAPALKSIIMAGDTPLTVGVFGAWGSGKSSLLHMLRREIEAEQKYRVRTVWFTAWKYDRQEVLWRSLILRVLEAMYPREPGEGPREERAVLEAEEGSREARLIQKLDRLAEAVYQPISWEDVGPRNIKWWQLIGSVGEASVDTVATLTSAGTWPKIKELLGGDGDPAEEIQSAAAAISRSVIIEQQRQLKYMEEFEESFADAIQLLAHDEARLIVFIDDLDRCLPEKAVQVLEAIKLFLEVEGAVFILGMDQEIIRRGIEARYGGMFHRLVERGGVLPIGGDLYLQKIVQIPFHLPALTPEDVNLFIETLGAGLSDLTRESFARGLHRNPRQVKRALNIFQLLKEVAEARVKRGALPADAIAWPLLAKTVVIQTQYPHLYQQWRLRPTLLITLEELYDQMMAPPEKGRPGAPADESAKTVSPDVSSAVSGQEGILDRYLPDTATNLFLREMLTYPAPGDHGAGSERSRFRGLRRGEIERYVRLAGSVAVTPGAEGVAQIPLDLAEFLSGDTARIREAVAFIDEERDENRRNAYRKRLVSVLQDERRPVPERVSAGDSLAQLGDPRFRDDAWFLPEEPLLGFIKIPAGSFMMGSDPERDRASREDEQAPFEVRLSEFYIARYPVTVAQFLAFYQAQAAEEGEPERRRRVLDLYERATGLYDDQLNQPMVLVRWDEAMAYCRWLTHELREWPHTPATLQKLLENEGWEITLPTEPQWEKAARGQEGRIYPWGDDFEPTMANTQEIDLNKVSAVGAFPGGASPYGALDMSGNVWEWTRSEYRSYSGRRKQDEASWVDAYERQVLRGGSFRTERTVARCAFRNWVSPGVNDDDLGFRVVLSPSMKTTL